MKQWVSFFFLAIIFFSSCSKDKDKSMPVITIDHPTVDQLFNALDTIQVEATIEDETALEQIEITVCDENKVPVLSTLTISPQDKKTTVNIQYPLDDINLASGDYYLWIKAFDGTNTASKYRGIHITEVPRELKYIYIMSLASSTTVHMQRQVVNGSLENLTDINGDISSTASSSKFHLVASCGSTYGDMNIFDVSSNTLLWSVPTVANPPFPYFEYLSQYNEVFYCSLYDGYIKGYNNAGTQVFSAASDAGTFPCKIFANTNYLFADHGLYSGNNRTFGVYYISSGAMKQWISTDYDITNIFQKDEDNVFLFANQNGQGIIKLYSISANSAWEPHTLPAGAIYDVVQIDENNYIIAHESGLYNYQYNPNSLTTFISGINATKIKYDGVNNDLYVAQGNTINVYDYSSHALVSSITAAYSVAGFELLYNR
jgi:hypothetical protein